MGVLEHGDGELRRAAEFPRQRPFGAVIGAEDAAEDLAARGGARDLLDLLAAVDREEADAALEGGGDVALLLDGVAVGDALGGGAGGERHVDLGNARAIEGRAEAREQLQHFRLGIGLDRVEDAAVRQRLGEGEVVLAHDIEVDDEAGAVGSSVAEEIADTVGHSRALPSERVETAGPLLLARRCGDGSAPDFAVRFAGSSPTGFFRLAVERRTGQSGLSLPSLGAGEPVPHARQDVDASSVTPADGEPAETKKARYVVALSRVLRSIPGSVPGCSPSDMLRPQARANLGKERTYARLVSQSRIFRVRAEKSWSGCR